MESKLSRIKNPTAVGLKDEIEVIIRPLEPEDWVELKNLYQRVSQESRFFRFLAPKSCLTDFEVQYLSSVDQISRVAFVAEQDTNENSEIIGVVRYDVCPPKQDLAEFAIFVEDKYQDQGLGAVLFYHLVSFAKEKGIKTLIAFVHFGNWKMLRLLRNSGLLLNCIRDFGMWEINISLDSKLAIEKNNKPHQQIGSMN